MIFVFEVIMYEFDSFAQYAYVYLVKVWFCKYLLCRDMQYHCS